MDNNNNRSTRRSQSMRSGQSGSAGRTDKRSQGMRSQNLQAKREAEAELKAAASKPTLDEVVQQEENALEASLAKAVQEQTSQPEEPVMEDTVFIKESALRDAGYNLDDIDFGAEAEAEEVRDAAEEAEAGLTQAVSREELRKARKGSRPEPEPEPVKKGKKKKKQKEILTPKQRAIRWIIGIIVFLIVAGICAIGFFTTYNIFYDIPVHPESTEVYELTITDDMSVDQVFNILVDKDLIANDSFVFKIRCKLFDLKTVAGKYKVSPSYNTEKIINIISGYDYSDGTMEDE